MQDQSSLGKLPTLGAQDIHAMGRAIWHFINLTLKHEASAAYPQKLPIKQQDPVKFKSTVFIGLIVIISTLIVFSKLIHKLDSTQDLA